MKRFLRAVALLVAIASALLGWGFLIEPGLLTVDRHALALSRWPADYPALRVALIGDLHAGAPFISLDRVSEIVARTNAAHPDLIVLLGDYVIQNVPGGHRIPIEPIAEHLRALSAPLGTIAVLGNHDWWENGPRIRRAFEAVGITVLDNQAVRRALDGRPLWIAGLADAITRRPSYAQALTAVDDGPVIVLSHSPEPFATLPPEPVIMLAAHTHGGQVRLPLIGSLVTARRVPHRWMFGHVVEDGRDLFVTTGIGTSIMPVRFLTPPVIDVLEIRAGERR
ncbi:MAG: metallophosphoesterase [Proteobacteria bacterium]|nr:metallophosphoesterase [Pseudomonadota bacterium]